MPSIRDALPADYSAWRMLWAGYLDFYQVQLEEETTTNTWDSAMNPLVPRRIRVLEVDGGLAGFALIQFQTSSWQVRPVCYLEDLFISESHRGKGLGRAMLDDLLGTAKESGCSEFYWHARRDNAHARRLYDSYVREDGNVRYRLPIG
ncbi:GNAT superfamily N-acetyltransferase [Rhizobium mesoamericanum]|uniref:GNAT family N-acetyltransferase n=1 Tax=Rhizobium mesoamericanum TaxID=1079800 RepID=UPI002789EE4E|nr:GNAT family N-acetyltransferase [Rhizobium mesoamericanum]MDQ0561063.1 GNAT superfamily N-acetyltransferase [Rhizobium mesoamericanum]